MMRKKKTLSFLAIILVVFTGVWLLNYFTHYTSDDYCYHFFYGLVQNESDVRWLSGAADIPLSMWNHYNLWGGRVVAHSIVQFFSLFHKNVFNFFNTLVYIGLGAVLYLHIETNVKRWKPWALLLIYLLMWMWIPQFGTSVLWMSGACNYLWMCTLLLCFLLPYRFYTEDEKINRFKHLLTFAMIPLGLLSGCTNENGGGAAILLSILYMGIWIWNKKKIPLWSIVGTVTACVGFLFLIAAPGNGERESLTLIGWSEILRRLREMVGFSYHAVLIPGIIFIILFCVIKAKTRISFWECIPKYLLPISYVIAGAASVVVLLMSPILAARSWMFAVSFMIIADGILFLDAIKISGWKVSVVRKWILCVSAFCICTYSVALFDIHKTYVQINEEIQEIKEQKAEGILDVTVTKFEPTENLYNAFSKTRDLSADRNDTFNKWMARYYGVNSIGIYEDSEKEQE